MRPRAYGSGPPVVIGPAVWRDPVSPWGKVSRNRMPARPAPARDQLDGRRGTDRRHAWSHRNSISGEWQCHDRERTEKSEDGDTHLKPPSSGVPSSAITTY